MNRATKIGCTVIALALAGAIAVLMYKTSRLLTAQPIRTLEELELRTHFRWPAGTMLVEAQWQMVGGETFYWAVLRLSRTAASSTTVDMV